MPGTERAVVEHASRLGRSLLILLALLFTQIPSLALALVEGSCGDGVYSWVNRAASDLRLDIQVLSCPPDVDLAVVHLPATGLEPGLSIEIRRGGAPSFLQVGDLHLAPIIDKDFNSLPEDQQEAFGRLADWVGENRDLLRFESKAVAAGTAPQVTPDDFLPLPVANLFYAALLAGFLLFLIPFLWRRAEPWELLLFAVALAFRLLHSFVTPGTYRSWEIFWQRLGISPAEPMVLSYPLALRFSGPGSNSLSLNLLLIGLSLISALAPLLFLRLASCSGTGTRVAAAVAGFLALDPLSAVLGAGPGTFGIFLVIQLGIGFLLLGFSRSFSRGAWMLSLLQAAAAVSGILILLSSHPLLWTLIPVSLLSAWVSAEKKRPVALAGAGAVLFATSLFLVLDLGASTVIERLSAVPWTGLDQAPGQIWKAGLIFILSAGAALLLIRPLSRALLFIVAFGLSSLLGTALWGGHISQAHWAATLLPAAMLPFFGMNTPVPLIRGPAEQFRRIRCSLGWGLAWVMLAALGRWVYVGGASPDGYLSWNPRDGIPTSYAGPALLLAAGFLHWTASRLTLLTTPDSRRNLIIAGALLVLGLGLRGLFGIWGPFHHNGHAVAWLEFATGSAGHLLSGSGFRELLSGPAMLFPTRPDYGVFLAGLVMSAASPSLLFLLLRRLGADLYPSLVGAALLTLDPVHIWFSSSESYLTIIIFLWLLSGLLLTRAYRYLLLGKRAEALCSAVSAGLLAAQCARIYPPAWLPLALIPLVLLALEPREESAISRLKLTGLGGLLIAGAVLVFSGDQVLTFIYNMFLSGSHSSSMVTMELFSGVSSLYLLLGSLILFLLSRNRLATAAAVLAVFLCLNTRQVYTISEIYSAAYDRVFAPMVIIGLLGVIRGRKPWLYLWLPVLAAVPISMLLLHPEIGTPNTEQQEYAFLAEEFEKIPGDCLFVFPMSLDKVGAGIPANISSDGRGPERSAADASSMAEVEAALKRSGFPECAYFIRTSLCSVSDYREFCARIDESARFQPVSSVDLPNLESVNYPVYVEGPVRVGIYRIVE